VAQHRPRRDSFQSQYEQDTQNVFHKLNPSLSVGVCWFTQLAYRLSAVLTVGMPLSINTANRNELESPVTIHEMREFAPRLERVLYMTKSSFTRHAMDIVSCQCRLAVQLAY